MPSESRQGRWPSGGYVRRRWGNGRPCVPITCSSEALIANIGRVVDLVWVLALSASVFGQQSVIDSVESEWSDVVAHLD